MADRLLTLAAVLSLFLCAAAGVQLAHGDPSRAAAPMMLGGIASVLTCALVCAIRGAWFSRLLAHVASETDGRFRAEMRAARRWISWELVLERIAAGQGTLIIEQGDDGPSYPRCPRFWWTEEDVLALAPCDPPPRDELYWAQWNEHVHPFAEWCSARYFDARGVAFLTSPPDTPSDGVALGEMQFAADVLRKQFPAARVVTTAYWKRICVVCRYDLRASKERCPECGMAIVSKTETPA